MLIVATLRLLDLMILGSVFLLVLAIWVSVMVVWNVRQARREEKFQMRLGIQDGGNRPRVLRLWHDGRPAMTVVPGRKRDISPLAWLDRQRRDAGWQISPASLLMALIGGVVLLFLFGTVLSKMALAGLGLAAAGLLVFWIYLKWSTAKRAAVFERQFVDAMDLASRSLRAGHPLLGAFSLISEEIPAPVGMVFSEICQKHAMGLDLESSLSQSAASSASTDLRLFATSVSIQIRSGGNLADMIERLTFVIRDRIRLGRRVRVLTAQTQLSKRVLLALPFILFALLNVLGPEYMAILYETAWGRVVLGIAGGALLLGWWMMNRMAVLRF